MGIYSVRAHLLDIPLLVAIPLRKLHQTPSLAVFATLGCGVQTGAESILDLLNVQPGKAVAIFDLSSVT